MAVFCAAHVVLLAATHERTPFGAMRCLLTTVGGRDGFVARVVLLAAAAAAATIFGSVTDSARGLRPRPSGLPLKGPVRMAISSSSRASRRRGLKARTSTSLAETGKVSCAWIRWVAGDSYPFVRRWGLNYFSLTIPCLARAKREIG